MASAFFMLDSDVRLVASTGEKTCGGGRMSSLVKPLKRMEESGSGRAMSFVDRILWLEQGGGGGSEGEEKQKPKGLEDWVREGTVRVVADNLVSPPEVSTLSLHLPAVPRDIVAQLEDVSVTSADKNLLVLSTGPENYRLASSGRYLVYDAAADNLFLAPPINSFEFWEVFGCRPVVFRCGQRSGDFILAMVVLSNRTRQHSLLQWSPSTPKGKSQQWVWNDARLPDDMVHYPFRADVAFAFQGRFACWVDLYFGILTCDLLSPDPQFELKLLPEDYVMRDRPLTRGRPDGYSTVSCVNGTIKFLYMDGYIKDKFPRKKVTITTWTLVGQVPGLCTWIKDDKTKLCAGDLWADESFLTIPGLPKRPPAFPILSPKEPDVVYFFLSDIGYVKKWITTKGEHVLGLNLLNKKVQSWSKCPPGRSLQLFPSFIAAELSACQESSNLDDQMEDGLRGQYQFKRAPISFTNR